MEQAKLKLTACILNLQREGEYMSQPELLTVEGVYEFETAHDKDGNPYQVTIKE